MGFSRNDNEPFELQRLGGPMRRRDLVVGVAAAASASPVALSAQDTNRIRRVGVLTTLAESDPESQARMAALKKRLAELGWVEGRNLQIDHRWGSADLAKTSQHAADLVEAKADVVITNGLEPTRAMMRATNSIPIVFVQVPDPVDEKFVANLARPGKNVTGFANFEPSMGGKWLQFLRECAPQVARVALLGNPDTSPQTMFVNSVSAVAGAFGTDVVAAPVRTAQEIEAFAAHFAARANGGMIIVPDGFTARYRKEIVGAAERHRLPAIYPFRYFPAIGGLISYGVDSPDLYRRAAPYVDRILRGVKAGDMPVQNPTKFELVVNARAAKSLGLVVPESLRQVADEVIE
jgi:ABC-type uncharacterized transport system substrate-binding protein